MNARLAALKVLQLVTRQGKNLPDAINSTSSENPPLSQAIAYGVIRSYQRLDFYLQQLVKKPLRSKDHDISLLIMLGLYQLTEMRIPDHAAVSETVKLCKSLKKDWARNLVNGVLRQFLRQQLALQNAVLQHKVTRYCHPPWLIETIRDAWPQDWQDILEQNNRPAPMVLRVNSKLLSRDDYLSQLAAADIQAQPHPHAVDALVLTSPCDVNLLPGFDEGHCSIQDAAAQQAALLLDAQPGERVLDACAAPGGKTAHILERQPTLKKLLAIDIDAQRLDSIRSNLQRLSLQAELKCGDASKPEQWWDGKPFGRILLDAPCSASGVIRRHPDIKLLRRADDIDAIVLIQQQILAQLWPLLKPGGMLLYTTCSILPRENTQQVKYFLDNHADAYHREIDTAWGQPTAAGRQILPGEQGMDGFFYAKLYKKT